MPDLKFFDTCHGRNATATIWLAVGGAILRLAVLVVVLSRGTVEAAPAIDFVRDVQPIFARHCLSCHGVDKQEGGLRLDARDHAFEKGDNYAPAIHPGRSSESPLFQFVSRDDADLRMPPKGQRLNPEEIAILKAWIDAGANWPKDLPVAQIATRRHWSLQPVVRPSVPERPQSEADANRESLTPLDQFIAQRLQDAQLDFSPPAERRTLIRRLYLVMLGLPPTPAEVAQFVGDGSLDAWPRLVERVLANPRYGERWAQHWLDLVRFGETNGFETNRERPTAWHYRDYVIQAFNSDKPYDQFVREQLAGDAEGDPVGTGFLVAGPYDLVKSQDVNLTLMQRQDELADIINTTGTAFLGLTIGCARCHNHKFDPITQRDYYAWQAIFAGVQHGERPLPTSPERSERLAELARHIDERTRQLAPFLTTPTEATPGGDTPAGVVLREPVNARWNEERFAPTPARWVRFTVLATNSSEPCLDELAVFSGTKNVGLARHGAKARSSSNLPGYAIHQLEHVHDGLYGNSHSWISNEPGRGWVELELPRVEQIDRIEWGRDREGKFQDRLATRYRLEIAEAPNAWRIVASSDGRRPFTGAPPPEPAYDFSRAPRELAAQGRTWLKELEQAQAERQSLLAATNAYLGRFEQPGKTFRLFRGEPMAPREEVAPNTISILGDLKLEANSAEQQRRHDFARWLTSESNPLTARVWVNRIWQFQFGRGLVETPNDFGANGIPPSHPELLDWLASELVRTGWSTKHIQRLILLSRTWRQDSGVREQGLAADAGCRWLWRFPPRRLEAEAIRDCILAASGVVDLRTGGPGFDGFDVQLENVRHYFPKRTFGPGDWRRMIYMTKVRMEKESTFGVFDCPDASQVVARRSLSTTPLQALSLLNSDFIQQQAELLAGRLQREAPDSVSQQVERAYWLFFSRTPEDLERADALEFIREYGLNQFGRALLNANEFLFIP